MKSSGKKLFYTRWWFWLIGIVVVIGIAAPSNSDDDVKKDVPSFSPSTVESTLESDVEQPPEEADESVQDNTIAEQTDNTPESEESGINTVEEQAEKREAEKQETERQEVGQQEEPEQTVEENPPAAETPKDNSQTVYVSKSGKIHSVHDCSGMKNYREMSLNEALSKNYKYCKNCW